LAQPSLQSFSLTHIAHKYGSFYINTQVKLLRLKNDVKANEDVDAGYLNNSKDYHEYYLPAAQVPDVLCF
jgi:hypothetical protein